VRSGRFTAVPPRVWTVCIARRSGQPAALCHTCGQLERTTRQHRELRGVALRHLAWHARSDLTPAHLRTCQCAGRGCAWHRRHRGCCGPITLALTRSPDLRT
jgi:hypothetical protein